MAATFSEELALNKPIASFVNVAAHFHQATNLLTTL